jgi:ribosomal protein S18 acetylase RimI-like enzyme
MSVVLRSALYLSINDLAEAQTAAYSGRWQSSVLKLAETCRVQNIDLGLSAVAFDRRDPIGIVLVGRRTVHGWLHDIAVAPGYRRGGMGTRLMQSFLQAMKAGGIEEVELDVAAMRGDAIGLYTRLGFQKVRTYQNLAATGADLGLDRIELQPGREVVAGTDIQLIEAYAAAQGSEPAPCWDRSLASLLSYPDGYVSRLMEGDEQIGLMHYLARPAEGNDPDRLRPLFISLAPGAGVEELAALLAATGMAAFGDTRRLTIRFALEPNDSTLTHLLAQLKLPVVAESYDMRLTFA